MSLHRLKTWPVPWIAVQEGRKAFEIRREDVRRFEVGDVLELIYWSEGWSQEEAPSPLPSLLREVTFVVRGPDFGIPLGFAVLSIAPVGAGP